MSTKNPRNAATPIAQPRPATGHTIRCYLRNRDRDAGDPAEHHAARRELAALEAARLRDLERSEPAAAPHTTAPRACAGCGKAFTPPSPSSVQRYCSAACRGTAHSRE